MSNSSWPHGLQPTRLLYPWHFPSKKYWSGCHFLLQGIFQRFRDWTQVCHIPCRQEALMVMCAYMLSHFSRVQLCDPMDCSLPDSSIYGILQARILEWVARPSSRGSSQPRDWTHISNVSPIEGRFFTTSASWKDPEGANEAGSSHHDDHVTSAKGKKHK